jgi:hypothetical protein
MQPIGDIRKVLTLTANRISLTPARVGRRKINFDKMLARFAEGVFARIDAVLRPGESRAEFIRDAVERELERRERAAD